MSERLEAIVEGLVRGLLDEGGARPPASTYRLQLRPGFGFREAAGVVPYLAALGVDAVYLSPVLEAQPGSSHGYDVVDHARLSGELGGDRGWAELRQAVEARGLRLVVDLVPNHMGVGPANGWWMDVLENGPSSVHAAAFDVDWDPHKEGLANKVLVPVLGDQYGAVLERGELTLARDEGALVLRYFDHRFPIAPRTVPTVLRHGLEGLAAQVGEADPGLQELLSVCTSLEKLAPREAVDRAAVEERAREKEVAKRRLAALYAEHPRIAAHVDAAVADLNGTPGDARSFDRLHALLEAQAYRLAYWRVAGDEINYRRFFDVNALAAVRMEEPEVFEAAHRRLLALVADGAVTGLRIDHPDGLYDPTGYFQRLQAAALAARGAATAAAQGEPLTEPERWALEERLLAALAEGRLAALPLYVVVEKILAHGEPVPDGWAVHGTTGYEFLNAVNGLFVDREAERTFAARHARYRGRAADFEEEAYQTKKLVCGSLMASELRMLARRLDRTSETDRRTRDFTLSELTRALVEYVSLLPVYRTYVSPLGEVDARDRGYVEATIARARRRAPLLDESVFDFLRDVLLLRDPGHLDPRERREWLEFTLKLQQITGAITAKALEDTAFYGHVRLAALNEVGGDPARFGTSPEDFHRANAVRLARWPGSMLATTTHDTKRSEDTRLRIDGLSEVADEWWDRVRGWSRTFRRFGKVVDGVRAPSRDEENLLYQTIVGTLPDPAVAGAPGWEDYVARIQAYLEKAMREAKAHTSWTHPDPAWEGAVHAFAASLLGSQVFLDELAPLARRVAAAARLSSLSQLALKLAAPGVPDTYQGTELWDLSLVDPDNRRPVDFARRVKALADLDAAVAADPAGRAALARALAEPEWLRGGEAKLWLLAAGLRLRRADPELFLRGDYLPLPAQGRDADRVVAFARRLGTRALVCVAPRLLVGRLGQDLRLPPLAATLALPADLPGPLADAVTGIERPGTTLDLADCLADFPAALLLAGGR